MKEPPTPTATAFILCQSVQCSPQGMYSVMGIIHGISISPGASTLRSGKVPVHAYLELRGLRGRYDLTIEFLTGSDLVNPFESVHAETVTCDDPTERKVFDWAIQGLPVNEPGMLYVRVSANGKPVIDNPIQVTVRTG